VTYPCCGLAVIFCGFISLLIGRETINIPEIFYGVHGFTGMTVIPRALTFWVKRIITEVSLNVDILTK